MSSTRDQRMTLAANTRISDWLEFSPEGRAVLKTGKVEMGQGIWTALAQIAADELGLDMDQVSVMPVSTSVSANEGWTSGSQSIEEGGQAVSQSCAAARTLFAAEAARVLGVAIDELNVAIGTFSSETGAVSYWDLAAEVDLDRDIAEEPSPETPPPRRLVGLSVPRSDLDDKVRGSAPYIHNLSLPRMVHARVARPPWHRGELVSLGSPGVEGADVVRDGNFVAVVSESEFTAIKGAQHLAETSDWAPMGELPPPAEDLVEFMKRSRTEDEIIAEPVDAAFDPSLVAEYSRPFLSHASTGPSCAVGLWDDGHLQVWCSSQNVYGLRTEMARAFRIAEPSITIHFREGSGCYGHNGADDVAYEVAIVARNMPGRAVRLQWMRADELGWAPYGPAAVVELSAQLDERGVISQWRHELWSYGSSGRPGYSTVGPAFWAAAQTAEPFAFEHSHSGGSIRNIRPEYTIPSVGIVAHNIPDTSLRTSALRSLGAHINVFAIESFIDELATEAGRDPLEFRLAHLEDARARAVIERAAEEASWGGSLPDAHGLGIGYARYKESAGYCAVVAEVEATTQMRVVHLTIAVDVGLVINPDGVVNQVTGGAIQATSWTTVERLRFDSQRVTSTTWETYPIMRFTNAPNVEVHLVGQTDHPPRGAGEVAQGPTAAAIGNALAAAIGVRVRHLPIDGDQIVRAIDQG